MITTNTIVKSEIDFRSARVKRGIAAHRGDRSRSSWVRRMAASNEHLR